MMSVYIYYDHLVNFTSSILQPSVFGPGLPDGICSSQKCKYFYILVCLEIKNFCCIPWLLGIVIANLVYFMTIWYFLLPIWYIFPFRFLEARKIWQPWLGPSFLFAHWWHACSNSYNHYYLNILRAVGRVAR
jgi:hypothetical protein